MCSIWQRYDTSAGPNDTGGSGSRRSFMLLISALRRLVTSCPTLFGVSTWMEGISVFPQMTCSRDSVAGTVVSAANATVPSAPA